MEATVGIFIQLTESAPTGRVVFVNLDLVTAIVPSTRGPTTLEFAGGSSKNVAEGLEQIAERMRSSPVPLLR